MSSVATAMGASGPARAPSPAVMKAIAAVRANDTEETRGVLQDVLEESAALAEAEYERRE